MLATNNASLNAHVRQLASKHHILLNVADKPALCDFYLGSVVSRGNLKVGISTNGKSPTIAKRLKEFFNDLLPEEIDETLDLMGELRNTLKGDFQEKVRVLNEHTKDVLAKNRMIAEIKQEIRGLNAAEIIDHIQRKYGSRTVFSTSFG